MNYQNIKIGKGHSPGTRRKKVKKAVGSEQLVDSNHDI